MKYIDIDKLRSLKLEDFLAIKPYPYFNTEGVLTESGFQDLLENMPPLDMFEQKFGYERRAGQAPHDRYSLEYTPDMAVPQPWKEFIGELEASTGIPVDGLIDTRKNVPIYQRGTWVHIKITMDLARNFLVNWKASFL